MALVEVFHLVASEMLIDPSSSTDIPQGSVVILTTTSGTPEITVATATSSEDTKWPVGLAADSRSQGTTSYTPESGSALNTHSDTDGDGVLDDDWTPSGWSPAKGALVMGSWGDQERFTQNRVADNYNEVFASGKMTVYHSGGEFWSDQFLLSDGGTDLVSSYTAGSPLFMSGGTAGKLSAKNPGAGLANEAAVFSTFKNKVGLILRSYTDYPSGVPGTETPFLHLWEGGNSMTYGKMLLFKLTV